MKEREDSTAVFPGPASCQPSTFLIPTGDGREQKQGLSEGPGGPDWVTLVYSKNKHCS